MDAPFVIKLAYLCVALASLATYTVTFRNLVRGPTLDRLAYQGLMRTAASRVFVGGLYTTIGIMLVFWKDAPPYLTLGGFILASLTWIVNARLDVRLNDRIKREREGAS